MLVGSTCFRSLLCYSFVRCEGCGFVFSADICKGCNASIMESGYMGLKKEGGTRRMRTLVADTGFARVHERTLAKGHKRLVFDDDVDNFTPIKLRTEGTDLYVGKAEPDKGREEYTILCKEFGLIGYGVGFKSEVSVLFLDEGYMLVTLHSGALLIYINGSLLMPTVGDLNEPTTVVDDIYWIDSRKLLQYEKYLGVKGEFMYDVEFCFELSGDNVNGMSQFSLLPLPDRDIDLSLGYIAVCEDRRRLREEYLKSRDLNSKILSSSNTEEEDFEDYESDEDEFEDEKFEDEELYEW